MTNGSGKHGCMGQWLAMIALFSNFSHRKMLLKQQPALYNPYNHMDQHCLHQVLIRNQHVKSPNQSGSRHTIHVFSPNPLPDKNSKNTFSFSSTCNANVFKILTFTISAHGDYSVMKVRERSWLWQINYDESGLKRDESIITMIFTKPNHSVFRSYFSNSEFFRPFFLDTDKLCCPAD